MSQVDRRLGELAAQYGLPGGAVEALSALLDVVASDPEAPTTVRRPEDAVDAHVADSLCVLSVPGVREAGDIADLGSGAGFPGLALAAALSGARVRLVEATGRKCLFLARAAERAGLENAEVVHSRAEAWEDGAQACDLVTARALAPLTVIAEYAAPLLRVGGAVVAWKGRRDAGEESDGAYAAAQVGLVAGDVVSVTPFPAARDRHLHLFTKVEPTPARYPRRPGMAAKRPLRPPD